MIHDFLQTLISRGMSEHTIRAYSRDLQEFAETVGDFSQLKRRDVHRFLTRLYERRLAPASIRRQMAAVKSFIQWAHAEGRLRENVIAGMPQPRVPDSLPVVPSLDEITRLIERTLIPRDRCILELLYGTGIRNSELCQINLDDFEGDDVILIRGKGNRERRVIYGARAREALMVWRQVRDDYVRRHRLQTPALFFSMGPNAGIWREEERLDVRSIVRIVKDAADRAGLDSTKYWPHILRHSMATHCLDAGMPLELISKLLGHARLSMTSHYCRVSPAKMLAAFRLAHPHA